MDYDEWFIREVEKGVAAADSGELLTHEEVGTRLERLLAEKRSSRSVERPLLHSRGSERVAYSNRTMSLNDGEPGVQGNLLSKFCKRTE